MTTTEFLFSLLSNFLATLIAGTILGAFLAFKISSVMSKNEKNLLDLETEINKSKTSVDYLKTILLEVEELIVYFEFKKKQFYEPSSLQYLKFDISFWEILKTGGEIPSLFTPSVLHTLTYFYNSLTLCNTLYEQFITAENNRSANVETMLLRELTQSLHTIDNVISTSNLELIIKQEIESTTQRIEKLEGNLELYKNNKEKKIFYRLG